MVDKLLIIGIKNKNEFALKKFIDIYGPIIKAVIKKILWKYPDLVEEVMNDTLLKIWDNIESYNSEISSFKNWSCSIARYRSIDALKNEILYQKLKSESDRPTYYTDSYPVLEEETINKILSELGSEDKELFKLLYIEGYNYNEISNLTGKSKDYLYNRISRAKSKLRKMKGAKND